jgi:hypothetical protein
MSVQFNTKDARCSFYLDKSSLNNRTIFVHPSDVKDIPVLLLFLHPTMHTSKH